MDQMIHYKIQTSFTKRFKMITHLFLPKLNMTNIDRINDKAPKASHY